MEEWAPKQIAWERDNVGLQTGKLNSKVRNILVALSLTESVVKEAIRLKSELIITHHPLIFQPLKKIDETERVGKLISLLIKNDIALYSAHTNLDFTRDGVSFHLAHIIGLKSVDFLFKDKSLNRKIIVYVPPAYLEKVRNAMAEAGAGIIGNYETCSFTSKGTGSFKPVGSAKPFTGAVGQLSLVDEIRLEMTVPAWNLANVIKAMRAAHPYEEVAYDVYSLESQSDKYGAGVIGTLSKPVDAEKFLEQIRRSLKIPLLRINHQYPRKIFKVACCGGSGGELLPQAINQNADAFITGDLSFHRFEEANGKLLLIDGGHYETEYPIINVIVKYLRDKIKQHKVLIKVARSGTNNNFIKYLI